jgi:hypothetical protein
MVRPRGKKSQAHGQQTHHAQSTATNARIIAANRGPTDDTQNKQIENDKDSVEALEDADSIPGVFMAEEGTLKPYLASRDRIRVYNQWFGRMEMPEMYGDI